MTVFIVWYICVIIMLIVLIDALEDSSAYGLCPMCHLLCSDCRLYDVSN